MPRAALGPAAESDLYHILEYTYQHFGRRQVVDYFEKIEKALHVIGDNPYIGSPLPGSPKGRRGYYFGSHVIAYRIRDEKAEVLRILHQRMNRQTL